MCKLPLFWAHFCRTFPLFPFKHVACGEYLLRFCLEICAGVGAKPSICRVCTIFIFSTSLNSIGTEQFSRNHPKSLATYLFYIPSYHPFFPPGYEQYGNDPGSSHKYQPPKKSTRNSSSSCTNNSIAVLLTTLCYSVFCRSALLVWGCKVPFRIQEL